MSVFSRPSLAAALALGAVVLACPAQAFVCEIKPYDNVPLDRVSKAASEYARKRIAEMQSIFRGRVVSAEYVSFRDGGGVYLYTYEVSQWFKGRGGSHAKVIHHDQCEVNCSVEQTIRSIESSRDSAVVFVDPFKKKFPFAQVIRDHIDGESIPCESVHLRQMSNEALPDRADPDFGDVIFRNELRAWLRTHQARNPRHQP